MLPEMAMVALVVMVRHPALVALLSLILAAVAVLDNLVLAALAGQVGVVLVEIRPQQMELTDLQIPAVVVVGVVI